MGVAFIGRDGRRELHLPAGTRSCAHKPLVSIVPPMARGFDAKHPSFPRRDAWTVPRAAKGALSSGPASVVECSRGRKSGRALRSPQMSA